MANETDKLGIILETESGGSGFQEFRDELKKNEQAGTDSAEKIEQSYTKALTKVRNVSAVAFAAVGAAIGLSVREAAAGEQAMAGYMASVRNAGGDAGAFAEQIDEAAMRLQRLTGFADDEFIEVAARMTDVTGNASGSIANLGLVADLAAARKIDLASAGDMVARAMEGELGMMGRMLPGLQEQVTALGENADKADVAAVIFDRLSVFQGRAADAADTMSGSVNILKGEIGNAAENIGEAFLPAVRSATEALSGVAKAAGEFAENNKVVTAAAGGTAIAVIGVVASFATIATAIPIVSRGLALMNTSLAVTKGLLLTIPGWGWAIAGAGAIVGLTAAIADFEGEVEDTPGKVATLQKSFEDLTPAVSDATGVVRDFSNVTAEGLEKAARDNAIPGISDFGEAVDTTTESIERLNATPLKPLNLSVSEGFSVPEGESFMPGEGLAEAMAVQTMSFDDEIAAHKKELWEEERKEFLFHTAFLQGTFASMTDSFTNMEMTGKQRREQIWNTLRSSFIRQVGAQVQAHLFGELAKQHATAVTAGVQQATFAQSLAASIAHGAKEIGLALQTAAARIYAFYASLGPFGIPAAAATVAGVYAAVKALHFQEGGIVPGAGNGDKVPALLEPGERVVSRDQYNANRSGIEGAIQGGGSGNTFHFHLDRDTALDQVIRIRELFESWAVPVIEMKMREGAFAMKGVPL